MFLSTWQNPNQCPLPLVSEVFRCGELGQEAGFHPTSSVSPETQCKPPQCKKKTLSLPLVTATADALLTEEGVMRIATLISHISGAVLNLLDRLYPLLK